MRRFLGRKSSLNGVGIAADEIPSLSRNNWGRDNGHKWRLSPTLRRYLLLHILLLVFYILIDISYISIKDDAATNPDHRRQWCRRTLSTATTSLLAPTAPNTRLYPEHSYLKLPTSCGSRARRSIRYNLLPRLFTGVDRAFLYSTPEAPLAQLFSAAKDHGVQYITLLSSLAIESDPEGLIAISQRKVESAIEPSGLSYTFLRAGNFSSNTSLFWLPQVEKMRKIWMAYPHAKSAPVSEVDIATTAVVALTTEKLVNQAVSLTGPGFKTHQEMIEAINRVRQGEGKEPFDWKAVSPEVWMEKTAGFLPPDFQDQLLAFWEAGDRELPVVRSSEVVTGKPSQSFDEWLECNKDTFLKY